MQEEVIIEGPGTTTVTASLNETWYVDEKPEEEEVVLCRCGKSNCVRISLKKSGR
jgi:CDGSH-type Zn-finger protein